MTSEKSPLLDHYNRNDLPEYQNLSGSSEATYGAVIGPNELPPPYESTATGSYMIACKVCSSMIDISTKRNQHVIKCDNCNEATPVKAAPPGKKYVRCPCHCLLICKASSERVSCPREECKRVITLTPNPQSVTTSGVPGMCQVTCGHCHNTFLFNTLNNSLARCPHCRKLSSVGQFYARKRGLIFLFLSIILFTISAFVIGFTYASAALHGGIYVVFIGLPIIALILLFRSIKFFSTKISIIEGPL